MLKPMAIGRLEAPTAVPLMERAPKMGAASLAVRNGEMVTTAGPVTVRPNGEVTSTLRVVAAPPAGDLEVQLGALLGQIANRDGFGSMMQMTHRAQKAVARNRFATDRGGFVGDGWIV